MQRRASRRMLTVVSIVVLAVFPAMASFGLAGCGGGESVDRAAVYGELATNVIAPSYADLRSASAALASAATAYCAAPSDAGAFADVRTALAEAHLAYGRTEVFEFSASPVVTAQIPQPIDTFPISVSSGTSTTTIEDILGNTYAIDLALSPAGVQGFYAVEFLLFENTDAALAIAQFTDPVTGPRRCEFLGALTTRIAALSDQAADVWDPAGTSTFGAGLAHPGELGSAYATLGAATTDIVVRAYDVGHDLTDMRLGVPLGLLSVGTTTPVPTSTPGYLGDLTKNDLLAALLGFERLYLGTYRETDGRGLQDLVASRSHARDAEVLDAIADARAAILAIPGSVDASVADATSPEYALVLAAFDALKTLQNLLSVSVGPLLGISGSAFHADGD